MVNSLSQFMVMLDNQQNYIDIMNLNQNDFQDKSLVLEEMFNRAKPKARYISQSHIEDETNSITKEIINGDIEVSNNKTNLSHPEQKNNYEQMLRRKFIQQIEKEKEALEHKLGYIENSLTSFEKYEYMRRKSSGVSNLATSRQNREQWRKDYEQEMRKIALKKRELAEKSKQKELQAESMRARINQEEKAKRKAELQQSIRKMKERSQKRLDIVREQKQKLKQILSKKELYQKFEERYQQREENVLQERKKRLAEIRELKQPINIQQIHEHEQRVLEAMREKQALRNRQISMNNSRTRSYRPFYQSAFYKKIASPSEDSSEQNPKQKLQKMRQFSQQVKTKFVPEIDEDKRRQMEERLERESKSKMERDQKEKQLLQKPKIKGLEYLELVKKLPKKKQNSVPATASKSERIQYKNYLGNISVDMDRTKPWKSILKRGDPKVETALFLQYESQKMEERLKRKEEYGRVMKVKDDGSIDQQYYQMVKAKLDLLGKE